MTYIIKKIIITLFIFHSFIVSEMAIPFCFSFLTLLWNGSKLCFFSPTRGHRQGDPISPYLFVLCMEKLACLITNKVSKKTW
jgi:hypothetical protein